MVTFECFGMNTQFNGEWKFTTGNGITFDNLSSKVEYCELIKIKSYNTYIINEDKFAKIFEDKEPEEVISHQELSTLVLATIHEEQEGQLDS